MAQRHPSTSLIDFQPMVSAMSEKNVERFYIILSLILMVLGLWMGYMGY